MSTEFKFFENCTFCQTRIGSTHCLLPFQLTSQYTRPTSDIEAIIEVTEIHTTYGIHALKSNFEIIHWIKNRPSADQIHEYSSQVQSRTREWYFKNEYLQNLSSQEHSAYADGSCQTDDSPANQDLESKIGKTTPIKAKIGPRSNSSDDHVGSTSGAPIKPWSDDTSDEVLTSPKPTESKLTKPKTNLKEDKPTVLNRADENHLIQDLLLASKAAYNMHFNQKSSARIDQLSESLDFEINIRNSTGTNYRPSNETSLDGCKAISKEIVAKHTHAETRRWEEGEEKSLIPFCLLGFPIVNINANDQDQVRVESALLHYLNSFMIGRSLDESQKRRILNAVEFELQRCDHKTTFNWMNGKFKLLKFTIDSKTIAYTFQPERKAENKDKEKKQQTPPYPPLDQKLLDYINTHLQVYVNQSIDRAKGSTPTMRDETKISKFIFTLAAEFLKRNKGWHNENSFTSPDHLTKIEDSTGLRTPPSESYLTFNIVKDVIDEFRKSYKLRYPKQTPDFLLRK